MLLSLWTGYTTALWAATGSYSTKDESRVKNIWAIDAFHRDSFPWIFAGIGFLVAAVVNFKSVLLPQNREIRKYIYILLYIDCVALSTYCGQILGGLPPMKNQDGENFDWVHFIEWTFTTPAMIFMLNISVVSKDERHSASWGYVLLGIILDECMLVLGFFSKLFTGYLSWVLLAASFVSFAMLCRTIGAIIEASAGSSMLKSRSLRTLEWVTYAMWSLFGILQVTRRGCRLQSCASMVF